MTTETKRIFSELKRTLHERRETLLAALKAKRQAESGLPYPDSAASTSAANGGHTPERANDEQIAAALRHFEWQIPGTESPLSFEASFRQKEQENPEEAAPQIDFPLELEAMPVDDEAEFLSIYDRSQLQPSKKEAATEEAENAFAKIDKSVFLQAFQDEDAEFEPEQSEEETHIFTRDQRNAVPELQDNSLPEEEVPAEKEPLKQRRHKSAAFKPLVDDYNRAYRPIRRRRYYRSGLLGGLLYFLFVVCVSVALASCAWLAADDMLSLNKPYAEATVYVGEEMEMEQIAMELYSKGLIRYRKLFELFAKVYKADQKIQPGTYSLSTKLDYRALVQNMKHFGGWVGEKRETVKVLIPEGKTLRQTFQILAEHGVCPYETLLTCAQTEIFDYPFLQDIPQEDINRLEGYLFPDTYEFYADSDPVEVIVKFLDNFETRMGDSLMQQVESSNYSLRQILTIASLIEMEAGNNEERGRIASVIYNRLQSDQYPYLQIDATIQYALEERKEFLTEADLQIDSPYNTYRNIGLPPGPITNPGLASIRAALNAEQTGYYFYALHKDGGHAFFSNYRDFNQFINSSSFGG